MEDKAEAEDPSVATALVKVGEKSALHQRQLWTWRTINGFKRSFKVRLQGPTLGLNIREEKRGVIK